MSSKTLILITGANQGLGYYAAQQLAATGKYHVLLAGRDFTKAEKAIESLTADSSVKVDKANLEPIQLDVTSDDSIKSAVKHVEDKYGKLDILLNNAGVAGPEESDNLTTLREIYRAKYDTNVFGPALATEAFLPLLRKGEKRIAFTSSGLSSLEWASQPGLYGINPFLQSAENYTVYRSTKTALNMIMLGYAKKYESEGFVVSCADPGYCATNLNDNSGYKDPRDGAKVLIRAAIGPKDEVHGACIDETKKEPW